VIVMSALAGKPKGQDVRQKKRWTENDKEIVCALMSSFELPLRMLDLQKQTGIKKTDRIKKHLKELQTDMIVEEVYRGAWRIHPSTFYSLDWQESYERGLFAPTGLVEIGKKKLIEQYEKFIEQLDPIKKKKWQAYVKKLKEEQNTSVSIKRLNQVLLAKRTSNS
jgi:hypothetical protein